MLQQIRRCFRAAMFVVPLAILVDVAGAQQDLADVPPPDPEIEKASFRLAEEFQINLFAADPLVRKPVQMAFDAEGRLWVSSPTMYPQIKPGDEENDRIVVIEDHDGDGTSDSVRVFADGLMMPTGVLPGDGGVYVAHGNELIHLRDTDGDGTADVREVVLDGFGTEDTHHVIHSLRWGPDGLLYFHQSYYIASHVETPFGVRRMNGGGIWQFDPKTGRLEPFIYGLVNSWGHRFDRYGTSFATDGAGGEGINYIFPGAMMLASPHSIRTLQGLNPGSPKHAGLEILSGRAIPENWQGRFITADFRANRINSFEVTEDGSGFASVKKDDLIQSTHVSFRPVDLTLGPDGAVYLADWYSPIIQHGEVDFKDARRDRTHGRIWRIAARDSQPQPHPHTLAGPLFDLLSAPEQWTREQTRRRIAAAYAQRPETLEAFDRWVEMRSGEEASEAELLEALWVYQTLRQSRPDLLRRLLRSSSHNLRAAAVRVLGQSLTEIPDAMSLLSVAVADDHPRVRLEAVRTLARLRSAQAAVVALRALDYPLDRFLEFAIWRTTYDLAEHWLPALEAGEIDFDGDVSHLTFALQSVESPAVAGRLIALIRNGEMTPTQLENCGRVIAALATVAELGAVFELAVERSSSPEVRRAATTMLLAAAERRRLAPEKSSEDLRRLARMPGIPVTQALRLAGHWGLVDWRPSLGEYARGDDDPTALAAIEGLGLLGGEDDRAALTALTGEDLPLPRRLAAARTLVRTDVATAAPRVVEMLRTLPTDTDVSSLFAAFLEQAQGPAALRQQLESTTIPADFARLGMRVARSSAINHDALIEVIGRAGNVVNKRWQLGPAELQEFLREVAQTGDPVRGEAVFRRERQACFKCHAIAGAGGRVAPDLVSVGTSAPLDYLVESLLDPNKKIKENYQSLIVLTDEGRVHNGIRVSQSDKELVLRTADDVETSIPVDTIELQKPGGSLMPAGLVDDLTRAELLDLVRFLSELGKVGQWSVGSERYVRRWQFRPAGADPVAALGSTGGNWRSVYSRVAGFVPLTEFSAPVLLLRFEMEVTTPGRIGFRIEAPAETQIRLGEAVTAVGETALVFDVEDGRHFVDLYVPNSGSQVRVELVPPAESLAKVRLINGK